MNVVAAMRNYISSLISLAGPGMKVLLLDKETTSFVSIVFAQSELLQKEVYLFESINNTNREKMKHMKCICFLRPSQENFELLNLELRVPKYGTYFLMFTNMVNRQALKTLAEADEQELVREVQEVFGDFVAISPHLFSLNTFCSQSGSWISDRFTRCVDGVISVLLALRKSPVIRYKNSSDMARKFAEQVSLVIRRETDLFDFRRASAAGTAAPLLLILDRRADAVTPLLNQWTYQAMVHELLGIFNNRVSLATVEGVRKELQEVVLSSLHDEFFGTNMYRNFGDIGSGIKALVEDFQKKTKHSSQIESIEDMKRFVEHYPQIKKMSGTVSKHVTVVSELSRLVEAHQLLAVSETEQTLACSQADHSQLLQAIRQHIGNADTRPTDCLRLVCLYALRYERHANNDTAGLVGALTRRADFPERDAALVQALLDYGGTRSPVRDADLFGQQDPLAITKRFFQGLKGVENVYIQHQPLLADVLEQAAKGKLRDGAYPYVGDGPPAPPGGGGGGGGGGGVQRPQDIIVFIIGGATYEESLAVHKLNKSLPGTRIVLGGSTIHNFSSFQEEMKQCCPPRLIHRRAEPMRR